jgi:hypothetical protein
MRLFREALLERLMAKHSISKELKTKLVGPAAPAAADMTASARKEMAIGLSEPVVYLDGQEVGAGSSFPGTEHVERQPQVK